MPLILTIDLEDWFHILDYHATAMPGQWEKFESRVEANTEWLINQLDERNITATFFCLGWIAEKYPALVKRVAAKHEIGSHGMNHLLAYKVGKNKFEEDVKTSLKILSDLTGKKIEAYRAAGFSFTNKTKWLADILIQSGIKYDSSIFPLSRNHGGFSGLPDKPFVIKSNAGIIKEFPISTTTIFGRKIAYSGGGYFRALPYSFLEKRFQNTHYAMTYFHPRDFDGGQPVLSGLPLKRRVMSYYGIKTAKQKFERLLNGFQFINLSAADKLIDWSKAEVVNMTE